MLSDQNKKVSSSFSFLVENVTSVFPVSRLADEKYTFGLTSRNANKQLTLALTADLEQVRVQTMKLRQNEWIEISLDRS